MPTGTPWTAEIETHYPLITETALSPDGTRVAYAVREPIMTESESRYITHLYLARVPEEDTPDPAPLQLTHGTCANWRPRWSPDGATLAFLSDRSGCANLYCMRLAGGEPWALTAFTEAGVTDFAWAPGGTQFALVRAEPPSEDRRAARAARDDAFDFDEEHAFQHLFILPFVADPRSLPDPVRLTAGRFHVVGASWLPDGARLAMVHRPTPVEETWTETRLALVPAALGDREAPFALADLTDVAAVRDWYPSPIPSPDGAWIACVTGNAPVRWGGAGRVVLYPTAGGAPRPLMPTPNGQGWLLGWSADGARVYTGEVSGFDTHIWALDASGDGATPLLTTPTYKSALHTPGNDAVVFAEETFTQPNAVWIWQAGALQPVVAPPTPAGWPADAPLPKVETLTWTAPDPLPGTGEPVTIAGYLVHPVDYTPGAPVPLVLDVHGGPASGFQRRFLGAGNADYDALTFATHGIAVLRANPRGSNGYGPAFRFANYRDWGGGDFHDLMAGIDLLVERSIADPDRLGIVGKSYGGYMTSWAITQTHRFRAAAVGAGVTNLMSFTGTADIPGFVPDYTGTEFWDDLEAYAARSALFHTQAVTTPTLIQHGLADTRVPVGQGRELYNALKRRGIPTQLILYPRMGHGMNEPRLAIDWRTRAVAWFLRWFAEEV